jgi:hypothetical protein
MASTCVVSSKHLRHNACWHVPVMLCGQKRLQRCARHSRCRSTSLCCCVPNSLASQLCGQGIAAGRGVQLSCTRQLLVYNAHVSAATVLHCLCNLRVLQTCSMFSQSSVAVVAQTAAAASQQGLDARIASMRTFPVACHAYLGVIPTRMAPVICESAALQQYAVGRDLRRSHYSATRRHSTATV